MGSFGESVSDGGDEVIGMLAQEAITIAKLHVSFGKLLVFLGLNICSLDIRNNSVLFDQSRTATIKLRLSTNRFT